ncbi:MAG: PorP/SprF family type IX secretion system membrane protein [Flavobacteriales bacterium]|nr:PorP/SprF family type IX secretion system membrane protein [Flavobacteriales bacterium]
MRILLFIFCFVNAFILKAQDVHFSQFSVSSMGLNPAIVGNQSADYKASFQKRTQWQSVANPFNTISFGFEAKDILKNTSAGLQFVNDVAGDANFTTSGLNTAINRTFSIDRDKQISVGILLGFAQRKVDFSKLIFEENEQLQNPSFMFFDVGIGGNYSVIVNDDFSFISGFSTYHINKPKQSLLELEDVRLEEKYNTYFLSFYQLSNTIILNPSLLYSRQGKSAEFVIGSVLRYNLQPNINLISQVFYRWNDAVIPAFGINYSSIRAVVSYDINTSDLVTASNNKGGFEFAIIYIWNKKKRKGKEKIKHYCPRYL